MEAYFSVPLARPRTFEILRLVKLRADLTEILNQYSSESVVIVLGLHNEICFNVNSKFTEIQIRDMVNTELNRLNLKLDEHLKKDLRIAIIKYLSLVYQMEHFENKILESREQERNALDSLCRAFQNENE